MRGDFTTTEAEWNKAMRVKRELIEALDAADRLFTEALPKFNWGASALDANAIDLLNTVPAKVRKALLLARGFADNRKAGAK